MKRLLLICLFLGLVDVAHAGMFEQGALTFSSGSAQVSITTNSVTNIVPRDSYVRSTWIINPSTFSICISSYAATLAVSTTTSPAILPSAVFSPDGPNDPYWGGLWATACGTNPLPTKISVIRTK